MMHILHIETGRHLYGGALQVLFLMEGLAKKGFRNTLVCPKDSAIGPRSVPFANVFEIPMRGEMDPGILFHLLRVIHKRRPHLLHIHSRRGADLWGGLAARLTNTRAVITRRVDNREAPLLAKAKYGLYDRIITISEEIRRVLLSEGIPETRLTCIPSAVDYLRYEGQCDRQWFSNEFGLDPKERSIGMIAQLIPRKGHRYLIQAAPKILQSSPDARFLIFGKGPLREPLERLCTEKGLADRIFFAGFRYDLERILPCLDLLIHPATMEGLGVALLQAAAAGVPMVATKTGGIPEIVIHGQNGYLTDPGDVDAIARASITLLENPDKAHRFGCTGRKMVASEFSIEKMVKGNLHQYRQVFSERPPACTCMIPKP